MAEFIKIAFRNLLRNKRRSVLTGVAILTGAFVLTFGSAYGDGIERQLVAASIAGDTGHITITARMSKKTEQEELISNVTKWKKQLIRNARSIERILESQHSVRTVCKRVNMHGMVSNGEKLTSIFMVAVEPEKETDLFQKVVPSAQGEILDSKADYPEIYISQTIAKSFHTGVGDTLTVMAQTAAGSANTMDVTVKGIFKKGALWRENFAYIRLDDARQLAMIGDGVTQFKVILTQERDTKQMAAKLRKILAATGWLSVKDWEAAAGLFLGVVMINRIAVYILCLVLFIVSMAGIINTMLMAVNERICEIGTMTAMGTKRSQIIGLFVTEAAFLGAGAAGLGVALASGLALWFGHSGIPAFNEAMSYMYGSSRTYPYLTWSNGAGAFLLIFTLTVIATVYPAFFASRLKPVEALVKRQ